MKKILLLGGGGHAKCVLESLALARIYTPVGIIDVGSKIGGELLGVKIIGADKDLPAIYAKGVRCCAISLGSVKNPAMRMRLYEKATEVGFSFPNVIHPSAVISKYARLGSGNYVGPGVIINPGAVVGSNCIINSGAIVEHDCVVGDFSHIAPGTVLGGGVKIGARSHIGSGSSVLQLVEIGADAVVGLGSVVIRNVPASALVAGNPAKPIRK